MSFNELKNLLVEYVRLLPRNCVSSIRHNNPFVIFHMSGPNAHQGRRREQIGIRTTNAPQQTVSLFDYLIGAGE
jgi:hypothetical protein